MLPVAWQDLAARPVATIHQNVWLSLAWLIVVTSVVMMQLWNLLLRNLTPVAVAVCANAQPPVTVLLSAVMAAIGFVDQQPDFWIHLLLARPLGWAGLILLLALGVVFSAVPLLWARIPLQVSPQRV